MPSLRSAPNLLSPDFHIACRLGLPLLADHEATPFSSAHGHKPVSLLQDFIVDRARTIERDGLVSTAIDLVLVQNMSVLGNINVCNPSVLGLVFRKAEMLRTRLTRYR